MSDTATEQLKKLYDSQLTSTKEQLTQAYDQNVSSLDAQKAEAARQTQKNLTRTAVESQQAQKNYAEIQNAYGLSSGAMSQARLAQDNQLQADLTALRAAQQNTDDNIERQRVLLAKAYSSDLAKAQADNDLARAEALYADAKEQDDRLRQQQEDAAKLMASAGDFSLYANLYGLTPEQVAALQRAYGFTESSGGSSASSGNTGNTPTVDTSDPLAQAMAEKAQGVAQGAANAVMDALYGKAGSSANANAAVADDPGVTLGGQILKGTQPAQDLVQYTSDLAAALKTPALVPDMLSANALGYGPITVEEVNKLVKSGEVEEYVEDGKIKYRKASSQTATPRSKLLDLYRRTS